MLIIFQVLNFNDGHNNLVLATAHIYENKTSLATGNVYPASATPTTNSRVHSSGSPTCTLGIQGVSMPYGPGHSCELNLLSPVYGYGSFPTSNYLHGYRRLSSVIVVAQQDQDMFLWVPATRPLIICLSQR